MDFKAVLTALLKQFKEQRVRYGLMGGFALGQAAFTSDNVSQYRSPLRSFGEIDFVHAFREASRGMLDRAVEKGLYGGELTVRVLIPEDIIGLKLQAITNDPKRRAMDMADIKALASVPGRQLDWALIERYADLLDARTLVQEMRKGA
jgi:hypothetical protein